MMAHLMWNEDLLAPERPAHKQEALLFPAIPTAYTRPPCVLENQCLKKEAWELSAALCTHFLVLNSTLMYSSHLTIPHRPLPKPLQSPEGELVLSWLFVILVWEDCDLSFARAGRAAAQAIREQSGAWDAPVTPWLGADAASAFGTIILQSHGLGRIPLHHFRMVTESTDPFVFRRCHSRHL